MGGSCFIKGTTVLRADGTPAAIEDILVGDGLLGMNGEVNTVQAFDHPLLEDRFLYSINGSKPFVTSEHPFMTSEGWASIEPHETLEEWSEYNGVELTVGAKMRKRMYTETVEDISESFADPLTQLYNFKLDGNRTYYADDYLVHNKGGGGDGDAAAARRRAATNGWVAGTTAAPKINALSYSGRQEETNKAQRETAAQQVKDQAALDSKNFDYVDYKTGKTVNVNSAELTAGAYATKNEDASSDTRQNAARKGAQHTKRYNEDPEYRRAYDAGELKGAGMFTMKGLKEKATFLKDAAVAIAPAVAMVYGGAALSGMGGAAAAGAGAGAAGGVGVSGTAIAGTGLNAAGATAAGFGGSAAVAGGAAGVSGLGASLHGTGAAVAPLGTAGASGASVASGIAGAGTTGLSTMEGGRNLAAQQGLIPGADLGGGSTFLGGLTGGLKSMSGLTDWIEPGLALADAAGSIIGGLAGSADSEEAQQAANPFAKYRDAYAQRLNNLYENPNSLRDTPGYQFRFDEGMRALNRTSAAKGERLSGNVLLEASRYGQGLADQMRGEEIDRLGGLSGATMGFVNAGYDSRSKTADGVSAALGTLGNYYGRTNYWDDEEKA